MVFTLSDSLLQLSVYTQFKFEIYRVILRSYDRVYRLPVALAGTGPSYLVRYTYTQSRVYGVELCACQTAHLSHPILYIVSSATSSKHSSPTLALSSAAPPNGSR